MVSQRSCRLYVLAAIIAGLGAAGCTTAPHSAPRATIQAASHATIGVALRSMLAGPSPILPGMSAGSWLALQASYGRTAYQPYWVTANGMTPRGAQLAMALLKAGRAGAPALQPVIAAINERLSSNTPTARAELDLILSGALLDAAVDPIDPTAAMPPAVLLPAAATAADAASFISERLPPNEAFWRLRDAIADYRDLAARGGWPAVPAGPKLEPGTRDARILDVRARLAAAGDLPDGNVSSDLYDGPLQMAVERFQARHGLTTDGVIGTGTVEALNVPVQARLATMTTNLRRLQRQGRNWGDSYIAVNVAAARYRLVGNGRTIFDQVTIVGLPDWRTPEVDSEIERIEFNPFWTVPPRIARLEVKPAIAKDPDYLTKNNLRQVGALYRQDPGPDNALGKAKFLFPNPYDVYLHDTNSPRLFRRDARHLSHGCVRIPNAVELAAYLLRDDPNWTREKIDAAIARGKNRGIALARPMPVHIVYDTAWVDDSGAVQFRKDIYGRDGEMLVASTK